MYSSSPKASPVYINPRLSWNEEWRESVNLIGRKVPNVRHSLLWLTLFSDRAPYGRRFDS